MSPPPARMTANARCSRPTGAISPSACSARARTSRSRARSCRSRTKDSAYVALTRAPVAQRPARVLAQPVVSKVEVTAKLCTPEGLALTKVPRRAKADYAAARRWRWGDAVMEQRQSDGPYAGARMRDCGVMRCCRPSRRDVRLCDASHRPASGTRPLELIPPHFRLKPCPKSRGGLPRARFFV